MRTPTLVATEPADGACRVSLKPDGPATGYVDGAWWPASRDLARELPALLATLAARLGRVERVTYNLTVWDPAPRRLPVDGQRVRLEGFRSQPSDTLTVIGRGGQRRVTLLVVPPRTDPATADRVLVRASWPANVETGMAAAIQRWEGEGGTARREHPAP